MDNTNEKKAKLQITISALALTVVLIAELFLMINFSTVMVIPIIGLGIGALAAVYVMINAIMTISAEKEQQRQVHFDNLYKSEKASYLMLKNKFEEIEEKLAIIQETSKIPSEEIINAQKGIAKVIINRSKENADAIINSNDQVLERLDEIDETQNTKFTGISKDQRISLSEMSSQTEIKLQDMVMQMKDMELRLNQAIMQGGGSKIIMASPEMMPAASEENSLEDVFGIDVEDFGADELDVFGDEVLEDSFPEIDFVEEDEQFSELVVEEPEIIEEPTVDLSDPNKKLDADDIAALFAAMGASDPAPAAEPEQIPEPIVEPEPVMEEPASVEVPGVDLSDPNKKLDADDIAALFAAMGSSDPTPTAEPEPIQEPIVEPEPVIEEPAPVEVPGVDLSDPNKKLDADDIAALFAAMGASDPAPAAEPEPVVEEKPAMPDLSDPNHVMTPEEIAALIANI